jgi:hypothetical protein
MTKDSLLRDLASGAGLMVMLAAWGLLGYGFGL